MAGNRTSPHPSNAPPRDYILGTHDAELRRLGSQHGHWREQALAAWQHAGVRRGSTVLDAGCGPGFGALDLANLVSPTGRVIAVDESPRYIDHLRSQAAAAGITHIETHVGDVQRMDLPEACADAAYLRWVLCFVPDPDAVIAGLARALRPGGRVAVQDYYRYHAMSMGPPSAVFDRVVQAVDASWRKRGGDPDIGCRLPAMMERHGLRVRRIEPLVRAARPSDSLWDWPGTFFRVFIPTLVGLGLVTADDQREFEAMWTARSNEPGAFFVTPPMIEIVAEKPTN